MRSHVDDHPTQRARRLAQAAHGDQRYGAHPYVVHLDEVASLLEEFGYHDGALLAAAYLHDSLEDTALTRAEIEEAFDGRVATMVAFVTDEDGPNRKERKRRTYARMAAELAAAPPDDELLIQAVALKLADRLANLRASQRPGARDLRAMYREEHPIFLATLGATGRHEALLEALELALR